MSASRWVSSAARCRPAPTSTMPASSCCRFRWTGPLRTWPAPGMVRMRSWSLPPIWSYGTKRPGPTSTESVVAAVAAKHPGLSVLQIDAHADLRDSFMGTPHNHACAMRRVLEFARATQVGVRSLSPEEAAAAPTLPTEIFYDYNMRDDP